MVSSKIKKLFLKNRKKVFTSKILCIGDVILDHYIFGKVERVSPEAPIPILINEREDFKIGGAGNVAINIDSLGAKVTLLTLSGKDSASKKIQELIKKRKNITHIKYFLDKFETPIKTRYINKTTPMIRVDKENLNFSLNKNTENDLINIIAKKIKSHNLVILSDYNKGLMSKSFIQKIVNIASKQNILIIIDPKKSDFSSYKGTDMITPNQKEISEVAGKKLKYDHELIKFGKHIIRKFNIKNLIITRSEKGMLLINAKFHKKFYAIENKVIDVTGAGDTVVAIIALMRSIGLDIESAVSISNYAASIAVNKQGTANLDLRELISKL